ncbi:MAG TPA: penicillin acylase family protein, partial [Bryobacteraceae bacterium]|nr:penicillin acylase family protein [Bryobacteraceae bacterium]
PRHWSITDSILVGLHMYRDLTTTWRDEAIKARMTAKGDRNLVEQLFPVRSGRDFSPGSNAWVVSGKWTTSGKPLLANDTHLEFTIPSTWYMLHREAPGLNVSGEALPGVPAIIIGHNDRIAWGVTNLQFDVQDLYIEQLNLSNGQYAFAGRVEQARPEREYIRVKGERPVEFVNWVTRHGPILTNAGGRELTLRWAAAELAKFEFPLVQLNQAGNWSEFRAALARFPGPGQNFVYSDTDGNIGYQATGRLPIRRNHRGDYPVDGSSGKFEWEGFIPFEQLPHAFNPATGYIITANQNPFPAEYPYQVSGNFAAPYRAEQIRARLLSRKGWKAEEFLAIQKDVYSPLLHFLGQQAVRAADKRGLKDGEVSPAVELLRNWNGQVEKGTAAPVIAQLLYQHLRRAIAERAAPGSGDEYSATLAGPVVERLLRDRPAGWFQDYDQVLMRALLDALEEGKRKQGRNPQKWDYGVFIELNLKQPVGSQIPVVGPYFNIGPVPMSGSSTTVKQTTQRTGPSMRFIADLGNWDNSLNNITIGQSGQFLSWHYKDQWDEYYIGKGLPMRWTKVEGSTLRVVPKR